MPDELLYFNGVNGATGEYLLEPQPPDVISKIAQGETLDQAQVKELKFWYQRVTQQHLGPKEGVDPKNLGQPAGASSSPSGQRQGPCPERRPGPLAQAP